MTHTEWIKGNGTWAWAGVGDGTDQFIAVLMLSGRCTIRQQGLWMELGDCQACVLPPDPTTEIEFTAASGIVCTDVILESLEIPRQEPLLIDPVSAGVLNDVFIERSCTSAHQLAAVRLVYHQLAAAGGEEDHAGSGHSLSVRAEAYMRSSLGEHITLDAMAIALGCSKSAFAGAFRRETGTTPMRHLAELRAQHARSSLEKTRMTVSEIARSVGYDDVAAFSHFFKRRTGLSPSACRSNAQWVM